MKPVKEQQRRLAFRAAIVLALIVGAALRLQQIGQGLPFVYPPDEPTNYNIIQKMLAEGTANPHFFRYPSLLFYVNIPVQHLISLLHGSLPAVEKLTLGTAIAPLPQALLAARAVTLVFGLALILMGALVPRLLRTGPVAGIIYAFLVALDPLLIRHSIVVTPDVPAAALAMAGVLASGAIIGNPRLRTYALAGLFIGLAAATKYNAGAVAVAALAAHLISAGPAPDRAGPLLLAALVSCAALFGASPFLLLDMHEAVRGFLFELRHYRTGHPGFEGNTLATNVHWLVRQTGLAGLLALGVPANRHWRRLVPATMFIAVYFSLISAQQVRFERNLLPLLPPVFLLIAVGAEAIGRRLFARPDLAGMAALLLAAGAYWGPMSQTLSAARSYRHDPLAPARQWLLAHVPPESRLALDAYAPHLGPGRRKIMVSGLLLRQKPGWFGAADFVVLSAQGSGRFLGKDSDRTFPVETALFETLARRACTRMIFPPPPARTQLWLFQMKCPP